jgi:hypothetical protein
MRDAPSQISLVVTGKLRGFSTERLLRMLARLGRDIDIVIRPSKGQVRQGQRRPQVGTARFDIGCGSVGADVSLIGTSAPRRNR